MYYIFYVPGTSLGWREKALPSRSWETITSSNNYQAVGRPQQQHKGQPSLGTKVYRGDGEKRAWRDLHRGDLSAGSWALTSHPGKYSEEPEVLRERC